MIKRTLGFETELKKLSDNLECVDPHIYESVKKLGEGGFGVVLAVRNQTTKEISAAKISSKCIYLNDSQDDSLFLRDDSMVSAKRVFQDRIIQFCLWNMPQTDLFINTSKRNDLQSVNGMPPKS